MGGITIGCQQGRCRWTRNAIEQASYTRTAVGSERPHAGQTLPVGGAFEALQHAILR